MRSSERRVKQIEDSGARGRRSGRPLRRPLADAFLRYGDGFYGEPLALHFEPFSAIFAVWIFVFYVAGLYDLKTLKNGLGFSKVFGVSVAVNGAIAIFFFLSHPSPSASPPKPIF